MEQQALETQFKELTGRSKVKELIEHLKEATDRDPAFAVPATIDAVNCISSLVKSHTNATEEHLEDACGLVSSALFNALTSHEITVQYSDDEEDC